MRMGYLLHVCECTEGTAPERTTDPIKTSDGMRKTHTLYIDAEWGKAIVINLQNCILLSCFILLLGITNLLQCTLTIQSRPQHKFTHAEPVIFTVNAN